MGGCYPRERRLWCRGISSLGNRPECNSRVHVGVLADQVKMLYQGHINILGSVGSQPANSVYEYTDESNGFSQAEVAEPSHRVQFVQQQAAGEQTTTRILLS